MEMKNLFECCGLAGTPHNSCMIYDAPNLKVLNVKLDRGQHLLLYSDRMEGTLSLVAMEGHGEFIDFESRRTVLKAGDIVISQVGEPHGLTAKTDLRLLVTFTPRISRP
ncbi:MAG: hypothetical protein MUC41_13815 [Syntrophobacteraceae bacterium]|nr:hypothetical protein [Syntrophobacteraceae bacterium]